MPTFTDSFTYSNGALATVSGGVWANVLGTVQVASNAVTQTGGPAGSDCIAAYNTTTGSSDNSSEADISTFTGVSTNAGDFMGVGVACRVNTAAGGSAYFALRTSNGDIELYSLSAGTFSGILGSSALAVGAAGDHMKIQAVGTAVTVYWGGVSVISITNSTVTTGTMTGVYAYYQGANNTPSVTLDNFQGADIVGFAKASKPLLVPPSQAVQRAASW